MNLPVILFWRKKIPAGGGLLFLRLLGLALVPLEAETVRELPVSIQEAVLPEQPEPVIGDRPLRQNGSAAARPGRFLSHEGVVLPSIPGIERELTQKYIRQYSNPGGIEWLNGVIKRGGPYLAFIRQEIARRDLPPEFLYLPVIESGYTVSAKSRAGAAGLWQFMQNSMAPFDMRITDLLDERMDFWKSTIGALHKLEENYGYLKDWSLALAAYNAGLGAIRRLVSRTGIADYWILAEQKQFKSETVQYIPKLLAVSYILSNPRRFGLEPLWAEDPQWTKVSVGRTVDVELLAEQAGIDPRKLKEANGELLHRITPPDPHYELKVPAAYAGAITAVLDRKDLGLIKYYSYKIKSGDTLSALAKHYGISVDQILSFNPGIQERFLKIGSQLLIPAFKEIEPYTKEYAAPSSPAFTENYLVKRGETLWSIALAHNVDPEALAEANGMSLNDILREGRILKTPIR
ncbi:MAG: LysM peptidoglycan-binding domain-containing protein [Spirochaetaceae bacterium]|nr:LysM peptidoglycan-binding domain-containing protein [Spirochaetaceae bacterium]